MDVDFPIQLLLFFITLNVVKKMHILTTVNVNYFYIISGLTWPTHIELSKRIRPPLTYKARQLYPVVLRN